MKCPCQSGKAYALCCEPLHLRTADAESPEQLMRSRYCAYALKNAKYIFDTYHSSKHQQLSLQELAEWAQATTWLKLEVNQSTCNSVTFTATYAQDSQLYQIKEHSRFEQEAGQWRYVDGDILVHHVLPKLKRNDKCPCGSQKKLKQCCGVKASLT